MEPTVYTPAVERPPEGVSSIPAWHGIVLRVTSIVLQLAGLGAMVGGAFELETWLGWIVLGGALLVIGLLIERALDGRLHVGPES